MIPGLRRRDPAARLGRRGERLAARWLRRRGWRLRRRDATIARTQVDLVVEAPDGRLVLVEVKTRRDGRFGPELALDPAQRRRLVRAARILARTEGRPTRVDLVAIVWPAGGKATVRHYEGVG